MWASLNTFSAASGDFAKVAAIFLSLIHKPAKRKMDVDLRKFPLYSLQHHASRNRREFAKNSFRPSSTDSLWICQTGQGISFYPPLHGIIPTIFENAKNGRKKTGNLFLISCLSVPFCMYDGYSVFNWLQFYK